MGQKDLGIKEYLSVNRRFADVCNYYIYGGRQVIQSEDLEDVNPEEIFRVNGKEEEKIRDIIKKSEAKRFGENTFVLLCIENEVVPSDVLPVRFALNEYINYDKQIKKIADYNHKHGLIKSEDYISGFRREDFIAPVVTIVLYLGTESWDRRTELHELFKVKDRHVRKLVNNYKINLLEPHMMEADDFDKLETEVRKLLEIMACSDNKDKLNNLITGSEEFESVDRDTAVVIKTVANIDLKIPKEGGDGKYV